MYINPDNVGVTKLDKNKTSAYKTLVRSVTILLVKNLNRRPHIMNDYAVSAHGCCSPRSSRAFAPFLNHRFGGGTGALDLTEKDTEYVVHLDAPGFTSEQIEIEVDGDTLTISGDREVESQDDSDGVLRWERRRGSFERHVGLGGKVAIDGVTASLDAGVLTVHLPKVEGDAKRHIAVVSGAESAKSVQVGNTES